ncbi:MAG: hypothetical protein EAX96_08860 [Candidatus Lokiarchaeota archaeon]|nr:hypothetical protein [Candidatus Lokiarchaeota archaeon]
MNEAIKHVSPGIILILTENQICGTWLLLNGSSCMIVEVPPRSNKLNALVPAELISQYLYKHKIKPIGITVSHHHWDHLDGINSYREKLTPYLPFDWICHESLIKRVPSVRKFFTTIFKEPVFKMNIEGEPAYLIYAPKHSETDILIIFRGAMITGDWWLGSGDPNPNNISPLVSITSINRVLEFLTMNSYHIHSLFSVHGNDFRYQQNVEELLKQTRKYHESKTM